MFRISYLFVIMYHNMQKLNKAAIKICFFFSVDIVELSYHCSGHILLF